MGLQVQTGQLHRWNHWRLLDPLGRQDLEYLVGLGLQSDLQSRHPIRFHQHPLGRQDLEHPRDRQDLMDPLGLERPLDRQDLPDLSLQCQFHQQQRWS